LIERDVKGPYSFNTSKITFLFTISTPRDLILFLLYCVLLFFFEFTDCYIVYVHNYPCMLRSSTSVYRASCLFGRTGNKSLVKHIVLPRGVARPASKRVGKLTGRHLTALNRGMKKSSRTVCAARQGSAVYRVGASWPGDARRRRLQCARSQLPLRRTQDPSTLHAQPLAQPGLFQCVYRGVGWLGCRVVSVLDSGAEGPGFKSQPRLCRVTVLGKLFTPICSPSSEIGSSPQGLRG